jgi:hypothetical protein
MQRDAEARSIRRAGLRSSPAAPLRGARRIFIGAPLRDPVTLWPNTSLIDVFAALFWRDTPSFFGDLQGQCYH